MAKPFDKNGDLGYERPGGTGMRGGTGKCVKDGGWVEPELGVIEMVEGRWGGAEPPATGDISPGSSPADRDPYSCFTFTSCLKITLQHQNTSSL